jgi:hypothetical protein
MKAITRDTLKIYVPYSGLDWMNYRIVRKSDMTAHHIVKKEYGGKLEIGNVAPLMPVAHQYLHIIEYKDIETYIAINKIFQIVSKQMKEPTREQREIIEYLLEIFEGKHRKDKGSKGKILIQRKYLDRDLSKI